MSESSSTAPGGSARRARPQYRNIHVTQILGYRMPIAAVVSILHRISGMLMFLLLPFIVWIYDRSVTSEISHAALTSVFNAGPARIVYKLVALVLVWSFLHHLLAGLRHVWMDLTHRVSKEQGHSSALVVLAVSVLLTLVLGAKIFGLY